MTLTNHKVLSYAYRQIATWYIFYEKGLQKFVSRPVVMLDVGAA